MLETAFEIVFLIRSVMSSWQIHGIVYCYVCEQSCWRLEKVRGTASIYKNTASTAESFSCFCYHLLDYVSCRLLAVIDKTARDAHWSVV